MGNFKNVLAFKRVEKVKCAKFKDLGFAFSNSGLKSEHIWQSA